MTIEERKNTILAKIAESSRVAALLKLRTCALHLTFSA